MTSLTQPDLSGRPPEKLPPQPNSATIILPKTPIIGTQLRNVATVHPLLHVKLSLHLLRLNEPTPTRITRKQQDGGNKKRAAPATEPGTLPETPIHKVGTTARDKNHGMENETPHMVHNGETTSGNKGDQISTRHLAQEDPHRAEHSEGKSKVVNTTLEGNL